MIEIYKIYQSPRPAVVSMSIDALKTLALLDLLLPFRTIYKYDLLVE